MVLWRRRPVAGHGRRCARYPRSSTPVAVTLMNLAGHEAPELEPALAARAVDSRPSRRRWLLPRRERFHTPIDLRLSRLLGAVEVEVPTIRRERPLGIAERLEAHAAQMMPPLAPAAGAVSPRSVLARHDAGSSSLMVTGARRVVLRADGGDEVVAHREGVGRAVSILRNAERQCWSANAREPPSAPVKHPGCAERAGSAPLAAWAMRHVALTVALDSGGRRAARSLRDEGCARVLRSRARGGYRVLRLEVEVVMADVARAVTVIVEHLCRDSQVKQKRRWIPRIA
jgi:hypothetical protein